MVTNDNSSTISMSSSFSPIYFFCVTAFTSGDFGDFLEDNSVAKRHVVTNQLNNSIEQRDIQINQQYHHIKSLKDENKKLKMKVVSTIIILSIVTISNINYKICHFSS